jgi:hypothetical protein
MGQEAACTMLYKKQRHEGKALLETMELIFRPSGGRVRLKFQFAGMKAIRAADGTLQFQTAEGPVVLELGPLAEKWCQKILHPKTRAEKLGVKSDMSVSLLGEFDAEFLKELRASTRNIHKGKPAAGSELIFLSVDSPKALAAIARTARTLQGASGLWVVYPKGRKEVTENDVIGAGRKAGLRDVKVVGFSEVHTALKFVIPLDKR